MSIDEKASILVVDDDEVIRGFLQIALSEKYSVDTAKNGMEGLEKLKSNQYAVILSDVIMPGMSGVQFVKEAKATGYEGAVVMMSGNAKESLDELISEGYNTLQKPFSPKDLYTKLAEVLEKH